MQPTSAHLRLFPVVHPQDQPQQLFVDENQKAVILVDASGDYFMVPFRGSAVLSPRSRKAPPARSPIPLGYNSTGTCLGARISLTHRFLAVQRSNTMVEIIVLSDPGRTSQLSCRSDKRDNKILGFLWCGVSYSDIVLITTHGLEFHKDIDVNGATRIGKTYELKCNWYTYSPAAALILCSTGTQGNVMQAFQMTAKEIVKLPKFELDIGGQASLSPSDLQLTRVYSRLMCLYLDRTRKRLLIFEVQSKQVTKRYAINLHSHDNVSISVVDNLIVVHNLGSKVSMLFDVYSKEDFPISAPLPIWNEIETTEQPMELYANTWEFVCGSCVMDRETGVFWEIFLDIEAVAGSCGNDMVALLDFLMRRSNSKPLLLKWIHKLIVNQTRLVAMARLFLTINQTLHDSIVQSAKPAEEAPKKSRWSLFGDDSKDDQPITIESPFDAAIARRSHADGNSSSSSPPAFEELQHGKLDRYVGDRVVIDQDRDIYKCVFAMSVVDTCSSQYLTSIVAEYMRTLNHFRLTISPNITCFLVSLLASSERYFQLHQFIQYKVINDSEAVAEQLLKLRHQHHASFQLAVDMLQRLRLSDRIVQVLLQEGKVLDALLYTRRNNLKHLNVRAFLEHALASKNEVVMFTVFRYFRNQREYEDLRHKFEAAMRELAVDDESMEL